MKPQSLKAAPRFDRDSNYSADEKIVLKKVSVRILGFLFVLMVFSFLDRINIGFAGITMARDLQLTGAAFGTASGVFYVTYILSGIPSNLMLQRIGARRWIAILLVVWGLLSSATMFAHDLKSLCILRALVGAAEGGFLPGMFLYLASWFPSSHRARAAGIFLVAMPVTAVIGSIASGFLLRMDGVGHLYGWQWLFALEGAPAVLLGIATWLFLADRPMEARWLTDGEKVRLETLLRRDSIANTDSNPTQTSWRGVFIAPVLLLSVFYFCVVNSLNITSMWVPQIVKSFNEGMSGASVSMLLAVPHAVTVIAMIAWTMHSDYRRERKWHLVAAVGLAIIGWLMVAYGGGSLFRLAGIALASSGANAAMAIFWTLPYGAIPSVQRALGISLINSIGNVGSAVSPIVVGVLKDVTHTFIAGIVYAAATLAIGVLIIIFSTAAKPAIVRERMPSVPL
ncbi:MFS transporter [Caballeronia sp. DA-9]|uniref:MFS transporter n=1 Tax=Caballeronia sp. DA-9 TaxID=3436237 RepID=UPI003F671730